MKPIYSIGYATKPIAEFIRQLKHYTINALVDVRSVPFSAYFPDYNQDQLRLHLSAAHIHYLEMGDQLGPRSKDPEHYDDSGQVQFSRLSQSECFKQGVERLKAGLEQNYVIALMCAEKDPAVCHRSLLISHNLLKEFGLIVQHINHEGLLESEMALQHRLRSIHEVEVDFFRSEKECLEDAYQLQVKKYAYRRSTKS